MSVENYIARLHRTTFAHFDRSKSLAPDQFLAHINTDFTEWNNFVPDQSSCAPIFCDESEHLASCALGSVCLDGRDTVVSRALSSTGKSESSRCASACQSLEHDRLSKIVYNV